MKWYFAFVFVTSALLTAISYTSLRDSKVGMAVAVLTAALGHVVWLYVASQCGSASQIMATGFKGELVGKVAGIGLPLLVFGAGASPRTIIGVAVMAAGIYISRPA